MVIQYILIGIILLGALWVTARKVFQFFRTPASRCSGCSGCALKEVKPLRPV